MQHRRYQLYGYAELLNDADFCLVCIHQNSARFQACNLQAFSETVTGLECTQLLGQSVINLIFRYTMLSVKTDSENQTKKPPQTRGSKFPRGRQGTTQFGRRNSRQGKEYVPPSEPEVKAGTKGILPSGKIQTAKLVQVSTEHVRTSPHEHLSGSAAEGHDFNNGGPFTVNLSKVDFQKTKQQARSSNRFTVMRPRSMINPDVKEVKSDPRRTTKATASMGRTKEACAAVATSSWSSDRDTTSGSSRVSKSAKGGKSLAQQNCMIPKPQVQPKSAQVNVQKMTNHPKIFRNDKSSSSTHLSESQDKRCSSALPLNSELYNRLAMSVDNYIGKEQQCSGRSRRTSDCVPLKIKVSDSRQKELSNMRNVTRNCGNILNNTGSSLCMAERSSFNSIKQDSPICSRSQHLVTATMDYFGDSEEDDVLTPDRSPKYFRQRTNRDFDKAQRRKLCGASLMDIPTFDNGQIPALSGADGLAFKGFPSDDQHLRFVRNKHTAFCNSTPDMRRVGKVATSPVIVPHPPTHNNQYPLQDFAHRYGALAGSMIDGLLEEENEDDTESDIYEPPPPAPPLSLVRTRGDSWFVSPKQPYVCTSPEFHSPDFTQSRLAVRGQSMFRSQIYRPLEWNDVVESNHSCFLGSPEHDQRSPGGSVTLRGPVVHVTRPVKQRQGMMANPGQLAKLSSPDTSTEDNTMEHSYEGTKVAPHELFWKLPPQSKEGDHERTIVISNPQPRTERRVQAEISPAWLSESSRVVPIPAPERVHCCPPILLETQLPVEQPQSPNSSHLMTYGHGRAWSLLSPTSPSQYAIEQSPSVSRSLPRNGEINRFNPSPCSPSSFLERLPKPAVQYTYQIRPQKTSYANTFPFRVRSDLELSDVSCFSDPIDLHPDSYIRSRPNFRSGFGGNYCRPDAGIQKSENKYSRSISLERSQMRSPKSPCVANRQLVGAHSSSVNKPVHTTNRDTPSRTADSQSVETDQISPTLSISRGLFSPKVVSPTTTWIEKTDRERRLDEKLLQLIDQLPAYKQNEMILVLLTLCSRNQQSGHNEGLHFRLREALQLLQPQASENGNLRQVECNCRTISCVSPGVGSSNVPNTLDSDRFPKAAGDTRMTQSCYQTTDSRDSAVDLQSLEGISTPTLNGHPRESLTTASSTSIDSTSDAEPTASHASSTRLAARMDNGDGTVPRVKTVLRRLARCLAVRIALKRQHLAEAHQYVARNTTEERWLRNKLNELFTMNYATPHIPSATCSRCDSSYTASEPSDIPTAQVVTRFDRWHNNIVSVLQLLCQLARRLAWIDAQLVSVNKREGGPNRWFRSADTVLHLSDTQPSIEHLKNQKSALQAKIKEAQELRAGLETCRIRLLENIPPGLKVEDPNTFEPLSNGTSAPPVFDKANATLPHTHSDTLQIRPSVTLRERITVHLNNTLNWLITSQILDTEIRVDQDLQDAIQDELRYDVN
ncbi:unnamed protein product [Dicrocoelium dendriticum]|nr:unnamed protein product [Dicrocoelium dendriticum]